MGIEEFKTLSEDELAKKYNMTSMEAKYLKEASVFSTILLDNSLDISQKSEKTGLPKFKIGIYTELFTKAGLYKHRYKRKTSEIGKSKKLCFGLQHRYVTFNPAELLAAGLDPNGEYTITIEPKPMRFIIKLKSSNSNL